MRIAVHHVAAAAVVGVAIATAVLVQDGPANTDGSNRPPVTAAGDGIQGLRPFDGCDQLTAHVRDVLAEAGGVPGRLPQLLDGRWGTEVAVEAVGTPTASRGDAGSAEAAPAPRTAPADGVASTTNVQEAGIDEPDIVETDGRLLLALTDGQLHVVDVATTSPSLLSSVTLEEGEHQLFLLGDRALIVTRAWHHADPGPLTDELAHPEPLDEELDEELDEPRLLPLPTQPATTELTLLDLRDPAEPVREATATVDGELVSARAADGTVRLVLRSWPDGIDLRRPTEPAAVDAAERHNRAALASVGPEQILPTLAVRDREGRTVRDAPAVDCAAVSRPAAKSGVGTTTVLTLRPGDGDLVPEDSTSVLADSQLVYASADRLYVATSSWTVRPVGPRGSPTVPGTGTSPDTRPEGPTTELHAFDTTASATTRHVASGSVDGRLLDQWSLSERDGVLRVAVTRENPFEATTDGPRSDSAIVTLAEQAGQLVQLGEVGGLGPGERIYAVRYLDDLATVVTFRQVDPLYTVDLSDPRDPRVLGELKIPGFSNYLHPVGAGWLLGVGQHADEDGRELGVQVSLFDIRDLAAPRRAANLVLGPGHSEVQHDHHAFLWWSDRNLAVLPVQLWEPHGPGEPPAQPAPGRPGAEGEAASPPPHAPWSGAVLVRADPDTASLHELARISHAGRVADGEHGAWTAGIRRAAVVDGRLLTVSEAGVEVVDLDSLEVVGWVAF